MLWQLGALSIGLSAKNQTSLTPQLRNHRIQDWWDKAHAYVTEKERIALDEIKLSPFGTFGRKGML